MVETKDKSTKKLICNAIYSIYHIFVLYILFIQPLLEARAGIQNIFVGYLVQMKSLEFGFEINWLLESPNLALAAVLFVYDKLYRAFQSCEKNKWKISQ